jgi:hypothetical protein
MLERRTWVLSSVFLVAGIVSCADDFDALFTQGPAAADGGGASSSGGSSGNAGGSSSGAVGSDSGVDSGGAGDPCAPGAAICTCSDGGVENTSCDVDGQCTANASTGCKLTYECKEHVDKCNVSCNHSTCNLRCDAEGTCSMTCGDDSNCVLTCTARPTSCNLTCNEGIKKDCGGGVFTCSATCP